MRAIAHLNFRQLDAEKLEPLFQALASPFRLRVLNLLINEGEKNSVQIQEVVGGDLAQPTISHHLNLLHRSGLLRRRMKGVYAFWSVDNPALFQVSEAILPAGYR